MCGRYTLTTVPSEEDIIFPDPSASFSIGPRYNIAPTQLSLVRPIFDPQKYHLCKWGLIPNWAKEEKIGSRMINARGETIDEKPAFKKPFSSQRCLVPANGFYEWKKLGRSSKQTYYIRQKEDSVFYFAGIYDIWRDPKGQEILSFSVITTKPNELMSSIHNRMPVILEDHHVEAWLDVGRNPLELKAMLKPYPSEKMTAFPVSNAVGNVQNDFPSLLNPSASQGSLF